VRALATKKDGAVPPSDEDANELAARISDDLDGAFPDIVERYGPAVYTTALRVSRQPADAEDLAAEAFVRAYRALSRYSSRRVRELRIRSWLVTIVLNLWRNQLRDRSRRPHGVPLEHVEPSAVVSGDDPEAAALAQHGTDRVARLLGDLSESQRLAVILRHVVGLSYDEIAEALAIPTGTAKSDVSRGLAALRARLSSAQEARQ
jgi:RNA polymerase sigma-70 factor (ECF subfamily)